MTTRVSLPGMRSPGAGFDQPFEMLDACHDRVRRSLDLLRRRAGGRVPCTPAERLKLANLLARRGFDGDTQRAALRQWAARGASDDDDAPDDADIDAD